MDSMRKNYESVRDLHRRAHPTEGIEAQYLLVFDRNHAFVGVFIEQRVQDRPADLV